MVFFSKVIALAVGVTLAPSFACTQVSVSTTTLTLRDALSLAQERNPEILAAKKRWEAKNKEVIQNATPDKPRLDIERMYAPLGRSLLSGADEKNVSITQEIPFPTTLYLRTSMAARESDAAEQVYKAKIRDVISRVRVAYAALYLSYKRLAIFNEHLELMRRFAKVTESKYVAGHVSQSDVLKAQVELTKMLNMGVLINQEKEIAKTMLNALLAKEARSPLGEPQDPNLSSLSVKYERLRELVFKENPQFREAELVAQKASKSLWLARSKTLPDLMLQYRQRNSLMLGDSRDVILGFTLPLWFWRPAAAISQARAEKEMAAAELEAARIMTDAEFQGAWVRLETTGRLLEIYKTSVFPQAEEALKIAEAGYQAEKATFLDLLDAHRSLLDFRLEYYQYVSEYEEHLAELERIVGKNLEELN